MFTKTREPMANKSSHVQAGTVYQTNDLDRFVSLNGNRVINLSHVKRLSDSISKNGMLLNPIIVNSLNEVIDGQHRLEAAKLVDSNIYYMVATDYGLEEVHTLNLNQKNWGKKDYLEGYTDLGYESYVKLTNFMNNNEDYTISVSVALCSNMSDDTHVSSHQKGEHGFETGGWTGGDFELAQEWADKIRMVGSFYDGYTRRSFVSCMVGMFKNDSFDFNEFMSKLRIQPTALIDCVSTTQYKVLVEDIYNYRRRKKINLRF